MTGAEAFRAAENVSRETMQRLEIFATLLQKWNPAINLIGRSTVDDLWTRHFQDSAQVFAHLPENAERWLDIGSGGGFPGLVVAILAAERAPALSVSLVESDMRKATFLKTVVRETGVATNIYQERVENLTPQYVDVISARALASLTRLLAHAERHLQPGGRAIFLKGAGVQAEIDEALAVWRFGVHRTRSTTDPAGTVLNIEGIARV